MKYLRYKVNHHFTREQIRMMLEAVESMAVFTRLNRWKVLESQLLDVLMEHDEEFRIYMEAHQ